MNTVRLKKHKSGMNNGQQNTEKGLAFALVAALGAGLCCVGPMVYLIFGISAAGLSTMVMPAWVQWLFITISVMLLLRVFWRIYISKKPICASTESSIKRARKLFWLTLGISITLITYPYFLPLFLA